MKIFTKTNRLTNWFRIGFEWIKNCYMKLKQFNSHSISHAVTNSVSDRRGFSLIELIISIAIFMQVIVMVGGAVMMALELNEFNKSNKSVNIELYGAMMNGIGAYIRKGTGIMYDNDDHDSIEGVRGTLVQAGDKNKPFERVCTEVEMDEFDQLTVYQDKEMKNYITFFVEKETSRLMWRKGVIEDGGFKDEPPYYLNSEDTYITCFLVSVSPDPYDTSDKRLRDLQPYVQVHLAGRYRYLDNIDQNEQTFQKTNTLSFRTLFTLRNYYY